MRNFLQAFLVFVLWASMALFLNGRNHSYDDAAAGSDEKLTKNISETKTASTSVTIKSEEKSVEQSDSIAQKENKKPEIIQLKFENKFITHSDHTRVLFPRNFSYFKDSIFRFLNNNLSKEILIVGQYLPNELSANKTSFGKARAMFLKNTLTKYGVNPNKLLVKDTVVSYQYDNDGFYAEGIHIYFREITDAKKEILNKVICSKIIKNSIKRNALKPDKSLLAYTYELKNYMASNSDKLIHIIGHSRKKRTPEISHSVGLKLANQLADYFIENGIPKSALKVISKGDTQPLDTNMSNSIKNRIEILIN